MKMYTNETGDVMFRHTPAILWKGRSLDNSKTVYSDRLFEWDSEKFRLCMDSVFNNTGQLFYDKKMADVEKFLSLYFDKDVELVAMQECENTFNGYPYWRFDYKEKELELELH